MSGLHLREATEEGKESRTIEGYALKFGVRSKLLCECGEAIMKYSSRAASPWTR